jgi:hypothetical protein
VIAMNFYNGFSPRERRAWTGLVRPTPHRCAICACGPQERPLAYHGEDYRRADGVYPICRPCHHAIHMRFRRPDHWQRLVRRHEYPGAWFALLSIDPASLWRPFDETYPQGLPSADMPSLDPASPDPASPTVPYDRLYP